MSIVRNALCAGLILLILAPIPAGASGDGNPGGGAPGSIGAPQNFFRDEYAAQVDPSSGSFATSVSIEVPKFRGLEPQLALRYSSSAPMGFAGAGWSLEGFSYIDRVTPGGGAPRFDANDVYALDGKEMVVCNALTGDWCTRDQSYERIDKIGTTTPTWEVRGKDGTTRIYTPIIGTGANTFRWGLTSAVDTHLNAVRYTYTCNAGTKEWCYPNQIKYNGASGSEKVVIKFIRQTRPDHLAFSTGTDVWFQDERLRDVDVEVEGDLIRRYRLVYTASANASRSLLTSVELWGLAAASKRPDLVYTYENAGAGGQFDPPVSFTPGGNLDAEYLTGDFNADGRSDVLAIGPATTTVKAWLAAEPGPFVVSTTTGPGTENVTGGFWTSGDWDGDGDTDAIHAHATAGVFVWESDGDGTFTVRSLGKPGGYPVTGQGRWLAADLDGNGDAEVIHADASGAGQNIHVWNRTGAATYTVTDIALGYTGGHQGFWTPADLNSDGRVDLVHTRTTTSEFRIFLANGTATFLAAPILQSPPGGYPSFTSGRWNAGDFNGDGRTDLLHASTSSGVILNIWLGTGFASGSAAFQAPVDKAPAGYDLNGWWLPMDMDGDGRSDLAHIRTGIASSNRLARWVTSGAPLNFTQLAELGGGGNYPNMQNGQWQSGDFDGDGRDDLIHFPASNAMARIWSSTSQVGNRMATAKNRAGGLTTVGYTPSTAWTNTLLPVGMILHAVTSLNRADGRGNDHTTIYEYEGGRWLAKERCSLGFAEVRKFDEEDNYEHTITRQGTSCITKPSFAYLRTPRPNPATDGAVFRYTEYVYDPGDVEETTPPFHVLESRRRDFECNLGALASCREIRTDTDYDGTYANVTQIIEYGDVAVSGDERTTTRTFYPKNTGTGGSGSPITYIVDRVGWEKVYDGSTATGTPVAETVNRYDQIGVDTTPPTKGELRQARRKHVASATWVWKQFTYDTYGNLTDELDEESNPTHITYDTAYHIFPESTCNAKSQCTTRTFFKKRDLVASERDPNTADTTFEYDAWGRPKKEIYDDLTFRETTITDEGLPLTQRVRVSEPDHTGNGLWNDVYFDGLGREWKTIKEPNINRLTEYHEDSDRISAQSLWYVPGSPEYHEFEYDGANRVTKETQPSGEFTTFAFGNGFVTRTDPLSKQRRTWTDAYGKISQVREFDAGVPQNTFFDYDALENLVEVTDAASNSATFAFDSLSRLVSSCPFDQAGCTTFTYYDHGLVLTATDPKLQVTSFEYDPLGRRTKKTSGAGITLWSYDQAGHGPGAIGHLTSASYPGGTESYIWSILGLETSAQRCIDAVCMTVAKTYDPGRRLKNLTYPDGELVIHNYHAEGYLQQAGTYATSIVRNPRGQVTSVTYGNGAVTTVGYANPHKLVSSVSVAKGATTLYQAGYGYNDSAQVTSITSSTNPLWALTLGYDDLYRLTSVTGGQTQSLDYDAIGNVAYNTRVAPAAQPYQYADLALPHAVTKAGPNTYAYDKNGNLTSVTVRTAGCVDPVRLLTWDAEDRLVTATVDGQMTRYSYDAERQRIKKEAGGKTTLYFGNLVELELGDEEIVTKYYYADGLLAAQQRAGVKQYVHQDHLDSLRAISDTAGAKIGTRDFAAFGEQVGSTGAVTLSRGYGAHFPDAESGLLYMGARYYDPVIGRFVQRDSVVPEPGDPQSWNAYTFVRNNPLNRSDPTGNVDIAAKVGGRFVEYFGGNRASGEFFGSLGGSTVPGVGELADVGVILSLDWRVGTGVRLLATASLVGNVLTGGLAPNAGGVIRQADELGEIVDAGVDAARSAKNAAEEAAGEVQRLLPANASVKPRGNPNRAPEQGTIFVDKAGNAVPTPPGGKITGSPDGKWIQARDASGKFTGVRIDGPHKPSNHPDPRAQAPHGHVPGVTNPDGTRWLPIKQ